MGFYSIESIGGDEYYTLRQHVEDIADHCIIPPGETIWMPFRDEDSEFNHVFTERGYNVVATSTDFFETDPPENCRYIVSNPPFSRKRDVADRIRDLGLRFIMIYPMLWLNDGVPLMYGDQIMLWRHRVYFRTPTGVKNKARGTCFAMSNGILDQQLNLIMR